MAEQVKTVVKPVEKKKKTPFPFSLVFGLAGLALGASILLQDRINLAFEIPSLLAPILLIIMGILMIKDAITLGRFGLVKRSMDRI